VYAPFSRNRSVSDPLKLLLGASPVIAMLAICGNRCRTAANNSNPDILGMRKSETIRSGNDRFSFINASRPSTAVSTI
jgi:hypothetical protein